MKNSRSLFAFVLAAGLSASLNSVTAATFTVVMGPTALAFSPVNLSVGEGDTVIWTNASPFTPHTATSGSPPGTPDNIWNSGSLSQGGTKTFSITFANYALRTYPYYCTFHTPTMAGSLTVTNSTVPPPPSLALSKVTPNNQVQFTVNGLIGQKYQVQSSTDLLGWNPVSTNLALSTSLAVTNLPAGSGSNNFYRVLEIP